MSLIVSNYRLFCITENCFVTSYWGQIPPTTCPNNTAHVINSNSISVINQVGNNSVAVQQAYAPPNYQPVQGRYRKISQAITVEAGQTGTCSLSFQKPVCIMGGFMITNDTQFNDEVSIYVAQNTPIGTITSVVNVNDTLINVNSTVIQNLFIGAFVDIYDTATNLDSSMIEVINIDNANNTITLASGIDQAFTMDGTVEVRFTVVYCQLDQIGSGGTNTIGSNILMGAYIPTNIPITFVYVNNSTQTQTSVFHIEYLY